MERNGNSSQSVLVSSKKMGSMRVNPWISSSSVNIEGMATAAASGCVSLRSLAGPLSSVCPSAEGYERGPSALPVRRTRQLAVCPFDFPVPKGSSSAEKLSRDWEIDTEYDSTTVYVPGNETTARQRSSINTACLPWRLVAKAAAPVAVSVAENGRKLLGERAVNARNEWFETLVRRGELHAARIQRAF